MNKIESLYIHIPYCLSKCKYCDFFSIPLGKEKKDNKKIPEEYVKALCNEISYRLEKNKCNIKTLYIGGGTPSLLTEQQLSEILNTVKKSTQFDENAEVTIEVNPDDVNEQLLQSFENGGIKRLSLGIQSMKDEVLKYAGRRADRKNNLRALECIKRNWKYDFSVDLISALPEESEKSFLDGLEEVISFEPDHISLYSLTIEDETPFGKMYSKDELKYDWDFADDLWLFGRKKLTENGYKQYEISNFCKNGKECLHNLTYWNYQNYIGCGSGGCGTVYPQRWTNTTNLCEYIKFWNNEYKTQKEDFNFIGVESIESIDSIASVATVEEREEISVKTQKFEFFMMGLRTLKGITQKEYESFFNEKLPQNVISLFEDWQEKNLVNICEDNNTKRFSLNSQGILFLNRFLEELEIN